MYRGFDKNDRLATTEKIILNAEGLTQEFHMDNCNVPENNRCTKYVFTYDAQKKLQSIKTYHNEVLKNEEVYEYENQQLKKIIQKAVLRGNVAIDELTTELQYGDDQCLTGTKVKQESPRRREIGRWVEAIEGGPDRDTGKSITIECTVDAQGRPFRFLLIDEARFLVPALIEVTYNNAGLVEKIKINRDNDETIDQEITYTYTQLPQSPIKLYPWEVYSPHHPTQHPLVSLLSKKSLLSAAKLRP